MSALIYPFNQSYKYTQTWANGHIKLIKMTQPRTIPFLYPIFPNDKLQSVSTQMYLKSEHEKGLFYQTIYIQHKMTNLKSKATSVVATTAAAVVITAAQTYKQIKTKSSIDQKIYNICGMSFNGLCLYLFIYRLLLINFEDSPNEK